MRRTLLVTSLAATAAATPALAIEFEDRTTDNSWAVVDTLANGCVASDPSARPTKRQWVGDCADGRPHGRGYLIAEGLLQFAAANQGRIYRTDHAAKHNELPQYVERANTLASFQGVVFAPRQQNQPPNSSVLAQRAKAYLDQFGHAPAEDRATVTALWRDDEARLMREAIAEAMQTPHSSRVASALEAWGSTMPPDTRQTLIKREAALKEQYRVAAEKASQQRQREAQAREAERDRKRQTACQDYYPGAVGRYQGTGFMALTHSYVVRYVNAGRGTVTIEMTDKSLGSYGEIQEFSCFHLWERSK